MLDIIDWCVGWDRLWYFVSLDLLHDDSLALLFLWFLTTHEIVEEAEGSWRVSRLDVSIQVLCYLCEH